MLAFVILTIISLLGFIVSIVFLLRAILTNNKISLISIAIPVFFFLCLALTLTLSIRLNHIIQTQSTIEKINKEISQEIDDEPIPDNSKHIKETPNKPMTKKEIINTIKEFYANNGIEVEVNERPWGLPGSIKK